jgi:hypothetical protein
MLRTLYGLLFKWLTKIQIDLKACCGPQWVLLGKSLQSNTYESYVLFDCVHHLSCESRWGWFNGFDSSVC